MAKFSLNINDPKAGKSYKKEIEGKSTDIFKGKKLKDSLEGNTLGFKGYQFTITGGSDKQGFPMRFDLEIQGRKKILLVSGTGAKKKDQGIKQRKTMRGNTLSDQISQINLKVSNYGQKSVEECLGLVEEPKEAPVEEATAEPVKTEEAPKEEVKTETKAEEKPVEAKA